MAARSVQWPLAEQTPSPGVLSWASAVESTVKVRDGPADTLGCAGRAGGVLPCTAGWCGEGAGAAPAGSVVAEPRAVQIAIARGAATAASRRARAAGVGLARCLRVKEFLPFLPSTVTGRGGARRMPDGAARRGPRPSCRMSSRASRSEVRCAALSGACTAHGVGRAVIGRRRGVAGAAQAALDAVVL